VEHLQCVSVRKGREQQTTSYWVTHRHRHRQIYHNHKRSCKTVNSYK